MTCYFLYIKTENIFLNQTIYMIFIFFYTEDWIPSTKTLKRVVSQIQRGPKCHNIYQFL